MKLKKIIPAALSVCCLSTTLLAQENKEPFKDNYGSGLKVNLDESGNKYLRFIFMNQVWARHIQNNPNTLVNGEQSKATTDIGLRRSRVISYAQISDRFIILTHFGINNQSFSTGGASGSGGTGGYGAGKKPGLFIHDAYAEYAIVKDYNKQLQKRNNFSLYFGAGMHLFNGVSRLTSSSTLNMMTLDAPIINWSLIDNGDQFGRQMGLYAKGNLYKMSYSFNLSKPFASSVTPVYDPIRGEVAVDNNGDSKLAIQGYVDYQFFDKESNLLPFRVGTYLGEKKVLNVGAGFYHNADATKSIDINDNIKKHAVNQFAVDVYGDLPIGEGTKKSCLSFYGAYYNFNFGPNYHRNIGIMNIASGLDPNAVAGSSSISGAGNSRLMLGTGDMLYSHVGYLLPKFNQYQKYRLMPYVAYTYKDIEAVNEAGHYYDIGANVFLNGHNAKISAQYSSRPLYFQQGNQYLINDRKGEFILQFQVFL